MKVVYIKDCGCDKVGKLKDLPTTIANHMIKNGYCEAVEKKDEVKKVIKPKKSKK